MIEAEERRLVASGRHTVILIGILLAIAAYGASLQWSAGSKTQLVEHRGSALPLYLGLIAAEWGLLRYVFVGLKKRGTRLRDLIGARWASPGAVARDVAIALAVWVAWSLAESLVGRVLGADTAKGISTLLPRGPLEVVAWIGLSLSAGICEEAVFRGYLQAQFRALTGSAPIAVLAQGVIFGVSHGYQGLRNVITITVVGIVYGALAHWRRSLKPGMILHAWMDVVGGLLPKLF